MNEFFFSLRSYNGVSRKSNSVSMKYQGCFIQVSWIGSSKGISRKLQNLQRCFVGVLREFQGCFKEVLRMIQESFRAI